MMMGYFWSIDTLVQEFNQYAAIVGSENLMFGVGGDPWQTALPVTQQLHRRSRINRPAAIASTASTILTVDEGRILSSGKSPVRINQIASRIIPRFRPARVLVIAI
jgi:hypothetical protein